MKKKYMLYGGIAILVLVIIVLNLISSEIDKDSLSDKEKYALFYAELTCGLADYGTSDMWQAMENVEELYVEYGYAVEEMENLQLIYEEDNEFWLFVMNYMKDMCPSVVDTLGLPNN